MQIFIFIKRIFTISVIFLKYAIKKTYVDEYGKKQKLNNPVRLRFVFQDLGGVFMKFGQILAMRFDVLPIDYAISLLNLLDNAPKVSDEKIFSVFLMKLEKTLEKFLAISLEFQFLPHLLRKSIKECTKEMLL